MPAQHSVTLDVVVLHHEDDVVPDATVRLHPATPAHGSAVTLAYDATTRRYRASGVDPGRYRLVVEHPATAPDQREITTGPGDSTETFVLGEPGLPFIHRGAVRVPFRPRPDLVGVTLRTSLPSIAADETARSFEDLGVVEVDVSEEVKQQNVRVFQVSGPRADGVSEVDDVVGRLQEQPDVERAGPVVFMSEQSVSFLTDELIVCFADSVTEETARHIVAAAGLGMVRHIPYAGNSYHVKWQGLPSYALLGTVTELNERAEVAWAEPNLASAYELDTVVPADFLWGGLWDRRLIGLDRAWRHLRDAGRPAFGSPDVIIADVDEGVVSRAGVPTHPEFQGTVSNGADKVYRLFDFRRLAPDNDVPLGGHGMGTTGVAAARADNHTAQNGQVAEGLAGAAPNCRVMGLVFPETEVDVADMYIWAAGFDPKSPRPGFPPPIAPGADVFTTSIGFGLGGPLSGIAKATIDHLTTYGRGGKGCLCFFSAGNKNRNVITERPYAGYERSFGTAATSLGDDGVAEIRAPYSGFGRVEFSAPSHDQYVNSGARHNPPRNFAPWSCALPGAGNLIGYPEATDELLAAAGAGTTSITVGNPAALSTGDRLLLGDPGADGGEPVTVTGQPDVATGVVPVSRMLNQHPVGRTVSRGAADYRNDFGGTSSATPLAAGAAALLLSAQPDLTWVEVREIMRQTAVRFNLDNADPVGRWLDRAGIPSALSGQPAHFSQWYGHGRIDAAAAVRAASEYDFGRDLMVRDNLADTGSSPTVGAFWDSPDVWVRDVAPGADIGAQPAAYAVPGPHRAPRPGQDNWVYVRVRNAGRHPSYDAYVRVYLAHWPGLEFAYPTSFIPSNRPGQPVPTPLVPGTYILGEAKISEIGAGADAVVTVRWPAAMVPPDSAVIGGAAVRWNPSLLVEVSPLDGPPRTGNHVWDSNNFAQKSVTLVEADAGAGFRSAIVLGDLFGGAGLLHLEVDRGQLPPQVQLYLDLVDPRLTRWVREFADRLEPVAAAPPASSFALPMPGPAGTVVMVADERRAEPAAARQDPIFRFGHVDGREVVLLSSRGRVEIPFGRADGPIGPIVVGGVIPAGVAGATFEMALIQRDERHLPTGGAGIRLRVR